MNSVRGLRNCQVAAYDGPKRELPMHYHFGTYLVLKMNWTGEAQRPYRVHADFWLGGNGVPALSQLSWLAAAHGAGMAIPGTGEARDNAGQGHSGTERAARDSAPQ